MILLVGRQLRLYLLRFHLLLLKVFQDDRFFLFNFQSEKFAVVFMSLRYPLLCQAIRTAARDDTHYGSSPASFRLDEFPYDFVQDSQSN